MINTHRHPNGGREQEFASVSSSSQNKSAATPHLAEKQAELYYGPEEVSVKTRKAVSRYFAIKEKTEYTSSL